MPAGHWLHNWRRSWWISWTPLELLRSTVNILAVFESVWGFCWDVWVNAANCSCCAELTYWRWRRLIPVEDLWAAALPPQAAFSPVQLWRLWRNLSTPLSCDYQSLVTGNQNTNLIVLGTLKEEHAHSRRALLCGMIVVRSTTDRGGRSGPVTDQVELVWVSVYSEIMRQLRVHPLPAQLPFKCAQNMLSAFEDVTLIFQKRSQSRGCGWWTALITRRSCHHANQDLTQKVIHCQTVDTFHVQACCEETECPH